MAVETLTAREANQQFSEVLRRVEQGKEFVVTKHGKPVARIVPVAEPTAFRPTPAQLAALERLRATEWHLGGERFDRESLHER